VGAFGGSWLTGEFDRLETVLAVRLSRVGGVTVVRILMTMMVLARFSSVVALRAGLFCRFPM
jgi:hypothetical protein